MAARHAVRSSSTNGVSTTSLRAGSTSSRSGQSTTSTFACHSLSIALMRGSRTCSITIPWKLISGSFHEVVPRQTPMRTPRQSTVRFASSRNSARSTYSDSPFSRSVTGSGKCFPAVRTAPPHAFGLSKETSVPAGPGPIGSTVAASFPRKCFGASRTRHPAGASSPACSAGRDRMVTFSCLASE